MLSCCVQCPQGPEEGIRTPEAGITEVVNCLIGVLGLNTGPLKEQQALLTAEPPL